MPTYDYECSRCGQSFEIFHSMKEDARTDCPDEACAGKGTLRRLISAGGGLIFKGSGFYQTDYKNSPSPAADRDKAAGKNEGKAEGKSESKAEGCACCPAAKECPAAAKE